MLIMLNIWHKKRLERSISDLLFKLLALQNQTVLKKIIVVVRTGFQLTLSMK